MGVKFNSQIHSFPTEKSILWTDTGVDQNFQRDLGAIGPYEFQRIFVWANGPFAVFSRKLVWTNGAESSSRVSPETCIGPWMALPILNNQEPVFFCTPHLAMAL